MKNKNLLTMKFVVLSFVFASVNKNNTLEAGWFSRKKTDDTKAPAAKHQTDSMTEEHDDQLVAPRKRRAATKATGANAQATKAVDKKTPAKRGRKSGAAAKKATEQTGTAKKPAGKRGRKPAADKTQGSETKKTTRSPALKATNKKAADKTAPKRRGRKPKSASTATHAEDAKSSKFSRMRQAPEGLDEATWGSAAE